MGRLTKLKTKRDFYEHEYGEMTKWYNVNHVADGCDDWKYCRDTAHMELIFAFAHEPKAAKLDLPMLEHFKKMRLQRGLPERGGKRDLHPQFNGNELPPEQVEDLEAAVRHRADRSKSKDENGLWFVD